MSERFASMPEILAEYEELERKMADPPFTPIKVKPDSTESVTHNSVQSLLDTKRGKPPMMILLQQKSLLLPIPNLLPNFLH